MILHDNPLLTDKELVLLIERLPKLAKIELSGCPQIRGENVVLPDGFFGKHLVESFVQAMEKREMSSITIKSCVNLSEAFIKHLAINLYKANIKLDENIFVSIKSSLLVDVEQDPSKFIEASKVLKNEADLKALVNAFAFGKDKWEKYFGVIDQNVPELPINIVEILCSEDPYFPGKKQAETRMLVLLPKTVNGKPLHLKSFRELVKASQADNKSDYAYFWDKIETEHGSKSPERAQWVLLTKDVIPGSRDLPYDKQKGMVEKMPQNEVPELLSATVAILTHYVRTRELLFNDKPWTYTRCKEVAGGLQTHVGGFALGGLTLDSYKGNFFVGVAALRKF